MARGEGTAPAGGGWDLRRAGWWSVLRRVPVLVPVTIAYVAALAVVNTYLVLQSPTGRSALLDAASTNVDQLHDGHVSVLLTSAFVLDPVPGAAWWIGLVAVLVGAELVWRSWRTVGIFALGHVGSTLLVGIGLLALIRTGRVDDATASVVDVGVSYGLVALAASLTVAFPRLLRWIWAVGWLAGTGANLWTDRTFTDAGHLVAAVLGIGVAVVWLRGDPARRVGPTARRSPSWTRTLAASVAAAGFALTETDAPAFAALLAGFAVAAAAYALVVGRREHRARMPAVA